MNGIYESFPSLIGKPVISVEVYIQWNLVNNELQGTIKNFHISRIFTLTVATSCISVIMPGDFKVVCIHRCFAFTVFILTRFLCTHYEIHSIATTTTMKIFILAIGVPLTEV